MMACFMPVSLSEGHAPVGHASEQSVATGAAREALAGGRDDGPLDIPVGRRRFNLRPRGSEVAPLRSQDRGNKLPPLTAGN